MKNASKLKSILSKQYSIFSSFEERILYSQNYYLFLHLDFLEF